MREVTSVIITSVGQTLGQTSMAGLPMKSEHFRCCMSVKVLVNTTMIVGGRKESTTKDLKILLVDSGSCLAS